RDDVGAPAQPGSPGVGDLLARGRKRSRMNRSFRRCITLNHTLDDPDLLTPDGVLGVDLGIVNIATDSTGEPFSGKDVEAKREWYVKRRAILQKKGTKAAKRRLRKMSGRQRRFQKWVNHNVSRRIVSKAERSQSAISLEDLKHIRARAKANKEQRRRLHNWGFAELRGFIEYKARLSGVPVFVIDPRNTSRQCSVCGHIDKKNRPNQSVFRCVACGHEANADCNAALNIGSRAIVTMPMFTHQCVPGAVESLGLMIFKNLIRYT
ncbi:MAG: transposase, partial [Candidatus Competibacteraceae bacterium]